MIQPDPKPVRVICDHANPDCGRCKHRKKHKPLVVTPFDEICSQRRGVCITVWSETICEPVEE